MTSRARYEKYIFTRSVAWRLSLDRWEDDQLSQVLKTVDQAKSEIIEELEERLSRYPRRHWTEDRLRSLLDELQDMTAGIKEQLGEDLDDIATTAATKTVEEYNDIFSIDGNLPKFNNVELSSEQLRAMVETPLGGLKAAEVVKNAFDHNIVDRVKQDIDAGLLKGESYKKLVDRVQTNWGGARNDVTSIVRTQVQEMNNRAGWAVADKNRDILEQQWEWNSILDSRVCIRCAYLDSQRFDLDDPIPIPRHVRCFTGNTRVSAPGTLAVIRSKYSGPIIDIATDSGSFISVTPNHRIMTDKGPLPAGLLEKGGKVVFDATHAELSGRGENNYGIPANFKDIFEFFVDRFKLQSRKPHSSGKDLHGDAQFIDGNIDIVAADSFLRGDIETLLNNDLPDCFLPNPHVSLSDLSGLCQSTAMFIAMRSALESLTNLPSIFDAVRFWHPAEAINRALYIISNMTATIPKSPAYDTLSYIEFIGNVISRKARTIQEYNFIVRQLNSIRVLISIFNTHQGNLSFAPDSDPLSIQGSPDPVSIPSKSLGDLFLGLSRSIKLSNITFLRRRTFNGHIYDLQTFSSVYHVEGMLASNCRCLRRFITKSWSDITDGQVDMDEVDRAMRPYVLRDGAVNTGGATAEVIGKYRGSYREFFNELPYKRQVEIVGPTRAKLLKEGKIKFEDLADSRGRVYALSKEKEGLSNEQWEDVV